MGTFITMLPTFGVGLVAFLVLVSVFDSISKIALFASLLVFNPVVKWGVYASSFALGVFLLGPVEGATVADASLQAGPAIVTRLVVGNLILAVIATALGYVAIHRLATRYDATELGDALETFVDDTLEASSDR
ncbi:hypothetical protein C493_11812 [Natronolimnohabitans innermongolicus JCM 12255]|uniref:DUF2062 domain-containing protein n=1 Tax=Natronolimnohabitans innermongolicus JCM 12255 TaxID=1227499 RepID=L9X084_9EURY|nr:hypothetical protein C493_11812 [Natronolimnohabitans innermongolicus JCM 12255]